jgi:hypothetical protein
MRERGLLYGQKWADFVATRTYYTGGPCDNQEKEIPLLAGNVDRRLGPTRSLLLQATPRIFVSARIDRGHLRRPLVG